MSDNFDWKSYDFIEEGFCCSPEPLTFSEVENNILSEAKSIGTGDRKIIGKITGCFQEIGGFSRNKRYYTPEHWQIQLDKPELQERLKNGDVLGTTGHFDRPVSDEDIREGRVSHIVRVLEIREDSTGKPFLYGEMEILDTKAGRNLKALYEGGANLYVSSRAAGKLLETPGKDYKTVDPMNFHFCTFDTVRRPGFLAAKPVYEDISAVSKDSNIQESAPLTRSADPALAESVEQVQPEQTQTNEDLSHLSSQVDKLARILEKVVNDVYETEEQPVEEATVVKENSNNMTQQSKASLISALALIKEANISEELMVDIVELIKKGLK